MILKINIPDKYCEYLKKIYGTTDLDLALSKILQDVIKQRVIKDYNPKKTIDQMIDELVQS